MGRGNEKRERRGEGSRPLLSLQPKRSLSIFDKEALITINVMPNLLDRIKFSVKL